MILNINKISKTNHATSALEINNPLLKFILFKKILAKYNSLVNLHDSAPNCGACLPEISGQNRANLLGYWIW